VWVRRTICIVRLKLPGTLCLSAAFPWTLWPHSQSREVENADLRCLSTGGLPYGSGGPDPTPSLSEECLHLRGCIHVAETTPAEAGGGGASFVPDWDKSLWAPGPTHSQGAFPSEDGTKSLSLLRSGGLSITCPLVSLWAQQHSASRSSGEVPLPRHWIVVADTTRVRRNFQTACIVKPLVFNTVRTWVIHNCEYRMCCPARK